MSLFVDPDLFIDPEAKGRIDLIKVAKDTNGNPYFIGKLQLPATMEFERGASFMVFNAEEGCEQLQIAPLHPSRINKTRRSGGSALLHTGKFAIDLHPMIDQNGHTYYVGEAVGFLKMDLYQGIFFTIFTSIPGQEQIQISKLQAKSRRHEEVTRNTNSFEEKQ
jgi:hypothetical protein